MLQVPARSTGVSKSGASKSGRSESEATRPYSKEKELARSAAPLIEARDDALQLGRRRGIALQDERIVARNDVGGRLGERAQPRVALHHAGHGPHDRKRARLLHVRVE